MDKLFLTILNMSFTGAFIIVVICLARLPLKKAPKIISYCLWAVAGFRLVFPFSIESAFSLIPFKAQPIPLDIAVQPIPQIDSGIPFVNDMAGTILPAAAPQLSANPLQVWTTIGASAWLAGVVLMLIYGIVSFIILKRKMSGAAYVEANTYEAKNIKSPFVLGIFAPKIYLPINVSAQEREHVILHERTHIQRRDHIIKIAAHFVLCLHWFNPFAWAAFLLMGIDMEMSCDERVLKEMGGAIKKDYSLSLLSLATERRVICGSPLAFGEVGVKARIKNVLDFKKPSRMIIVAAVALVAFLSAGFAANGASGGINPSVAVGDIIQLGGFDWVVLEVKGGKALVVSEKVLLNSAYHSENITVTWEECDLRQYLNGQFYDSVFSTEEKARIASAIVKNNNNPLYKTKGGNDTADKVFLLSIEEVAQYFGDSGALSNPEDKAAIIITDQFNENRIALKQDGAAAWWWTRTPGASYTMCCNYYQAVVITAWGAFGIQGDYVNNEYGGIRPALWLKL